ncbi:hypothetical protein QUF55_02320 [Clostridiaceae bacterium HSG29]|nr:hypothetical protein [Clostridiaceae bacterium HSG29]
MKKIISIMLMILLIASFVTGCGNDKKEEESGKVDIETSGNEMTIKDEDNEMVVSTNLKKSVDLPEGYPDDIVPIYNDLFLMAASKNSDESYMVVGLTNDDYSKVAKFYDNALEDAEVIMNFSDENGYNNMGEYKGYTYTILANDEQSDDLDYKTTVNIILVPGSTKMEIPSDDEKPDLSTETNNSSASNEIVIPEGKEIPKDYPEDILPFENGEETELARIMNQNGQKMLGYMSTSEIEDVHYYYENLLKDSSTYLVLNDSENDKEIVVAVDDYQFRILLHRNDKSTGEDLKFKTLIQIIY